MNKNLSITIAVVAVAIAGYFYFSQSKLAFDFKGSSKTANVHPVNKVLAAKFDYLSKNGNSSCSALFKTSIPSMPDGNVHTHLAVFASNR